jgi:hypothetical protein
MIRQQLVLIFKDKNPFEIQNKVPHPSPREAVLLKRKDTSPMRLSPPGRVSFFSFLSRQNATS